MRVVPPLPPEIWEKTPPEVRDAVLALVLVFEQRIAALEARLGQDSSNSSRPPSSDGPEVKRGVPRPPSPRRRGGQKGHPKHQRVILPPDQVIDHKPPRCGHCQSPLVGDDPEPIIEQVIDLPLVMRHVIHHRRHTLACPRCRATTTAPSVPEAARGFGPRLQAATAYFGGVGRLGKRAIRQLLADLHGIPISLGGVSNLEARTSLALQPIHDEALAHVRGLDANVDETAWKQGLEKAWLWVAVTKAVTVFLVRRHRDRRAFDDLVGPAPGVMTTDRFSVYAHLDDAKHQVCWAHLRRDFQAMIDRRDRGSGTGEDLLMHAEILAEHWPEVREGRQSRAWFAQEILPWLREEVRHLLDQGSRCGRLKTASVCRELLAIEASLWNFAFREGVEPTNNAAERAVRHAVCWRKTSYGTDSERGSRFVERMLSVVASCRSQGRDVMDFLIQAITAGMAGPDHSGRPSILPTSP
jgi:transposase